MVDAEALSAVKTRQYSPCKLVGDKTATLNQMPKEANKKKIIKKVNQLLNDMDWMFGLNPWDRKVVWKQEDEDGKAAEFWIDEKYQRAVLSIYPCFLKEKIDEQRKIILHELCHSITLPSRIGMVDLLKGQLVTEKRIGEINEKETSQIENLIHRLLTEGLKYAKTGYANYLLESITPRTSRSRKSARK